MDSDDVWHPGNVAQQAEGLDQRPDAGMQYGLASYYAGRGVRGPKPESIFELLLLHGNFILRVAHRYPCLFVPRVVTALPRRSFWTR